MKNRILVGATLLIYPLISIASDGANLKQKPQVSVPVVCSAKTISITPTSIESLEVKYKELCNGPAYRLELAYSGANEGTQLIYQGTSQTLDAQGYITIDKRNGAYVGENTLTLINTGVAFKIISLKAVPI